MDEETNVTLDTTLTSPTCPLTDCIEHDIEYALDDLTNSVTTNQMWLPSWTLEMITEDGREQLQAIGCNLQDRRIRTKAAGSENSGARSDAGAVGRRVVSGRTNDQRAKTSKLITPDQVNLNHTDTGSRQSIVMIHSWPLFRAAFTDNAKVLVAAGYQMITYDWHGLGQPGKLRNDYNYDTLAADLDALLTGLDLHNMVLLGFSMGGGKVTHYLVTRGSERVGAVILSGPIRPALCIAKDNPDDAVPREGLQELVDACAADHAGFVDQFCGQFCSSEQRLTVPEEIRQQAVEIIRQSVPHAVVAAILTWTENLREDCRRISTSLLVTHGDGNQDVPLAKSSARMSEYAQQAQLVVIKGGPRGINILHADQWNVAILSFLAGS